MERMIPKNVRQMGEPEEKRKIYVEDYVVTYLRQYAKEESAKSQGAVLLGQAEIKEGTAYLFIRSALGLKEFLEPGEALEFNDRLWMQLYESAELYFPGQEILGWFMSMPGFDMKIPYEQKKIQENYFAGRDKLLYIMDPIEGEEIFFAMDGGDLKKQRGYFVFYERNEPMQQYMLEKKGGQSVDAQEEFTDHAARSFRTLVQEKKEQSSQRRVMAFLYGVSTFLVMVVLVIGITMINNYEKMERVEQALYDLSENLDVQQISAQKKGEGEAVQEELLPVSGDAEGSTEESFREEVALPEIELKAKELTVPDYYIIQKGDTLLAISRKIYGTDTRIEEICQLNGIENSDCIFAGEKILLP